VLERVGDLALWAQAEGAISAERGEQIARDASRALQRSDVRGAA